MRGRAAPTGERGRADLDEQSTLAPTLPASSLTLRSSPLAAPGDHSLDVAVTEVLCRLESAATRTFGRALAVVPVDHEATSLVQILPNTSSQLSTRRRQCDDNHVKETFGECADSDAHGAGTSAPP